MNKVFILVELLICLAMIADPTIALSKDGYITPTWLDIGGTYRVRYESQDGRFRKDSTGSDQVLVERLLLNARVNIDSLYFGSELEDSRAHLGDRGTPLGTDEVNTLEILRAYIGVSYNNLFLEGDKIDFSIGRITIDAGSRRLVARNRFRNTINGFTGIRGIWSGLQETQIQAFYTFPVNQEPGELDKLLANDNEPDDESNEVSFWGVHLSKKKFWGLITGEIYLFGLHENDWLDVATSNRDLYTPGIRLVKERQIGQFDYGLESALQIGSSRSSVENSNITDLDHRAGFIHTHLAWTSAHSWTPRLVLQYDFASGDNDPNDGNYGRFDTLFGVRRFDFGPIGIYGAFARSNISSPGVRIQAKPRKNLNGFIGYRSFWLANANDKLTTGDIGNTSGDISNFLGHQLEGRLRYQVIPHDFTYEIGGTYLFKGDFFRDAQNTPGLKNIIYLYVQGTASF